MYVYNLNIFKVLRQLIKIVNFEFGYDLCQLEHEKQETHFFSPGHTQNVLHSRRQNLLNCTLNEWYNIDIE